MKYLLDTNICMYLIKHRPPKVLRHLKSRAAGDIGISSLTLAELRYSVSQSQHVEKNRQALDEFLLPLEVADFDEKAAGEYGIIRADLEKAGKPAGSLDLLIGAHAVALGATLATNNAKEFKRIKNLKIADWSA